MLKIGLTGGIGSGKSTVARIFEVLGVPVYYADDAAKRLMNENETLKQQIIDLFGKEVYPEGVLDKKYLAEIVFHSSEKLTKLNALVHPATINDANEWMHQQTTPYTIKEAALIFESGAHEMLDFVIGVHAPAALRIQRVMDRDKLTREEVLNRSNKQMNEEDKMRLCNFVVTNDEQILLIPQVLALHEQLLQLASEK